VLDVKNAVWGGLMSARAKAKGVQGVVIDGRVRDLNEHRTMQFPVSLKKKKKKKVLVYI
jgi:regulator of RNase E activity RraA